MRAETLVRTRGVDPLVGEGAAEVDLSLRVRSLGLGRTILAPRAVVTSRRASILPAHRYLAAVPILEARWGTAPGGSEETWRAAGFETVGVRHVLIDTAAGRPSRRLGPKDRPLAVPRSRVVPSRERLEIVEGLPRLRWTIDLASPPGPKGESWGDTHFARSLAAALERLGQRVAVDSRQLRHRASRDQDDVLLVLRGLDRVEPRPGVLSLEVDHQPPRPGRRRGDARLRRGLRRQHHLVGGGDRAGRRTRGAVAAVHRPEPVPSRPRGGRHGSRGAVRRQLARRLPQRGPHRAGGRCAGDHPRVAVGPVRRPVAGGVDLRPELRARCALRERRPRPQRPLGGHAARRLRVQPALRRRGRGRRILSDDIAGLGDLFGGLVQIYRDENDMRRLLEESDAVFPDDEERRRVAARIVADHSFDARARTLADAAARLHLARTR